jgi:hypothetical protein
MWVIQGIGEIIPQIFKFRNPQSAMVTEPEDFLPNVDAMQ